MSHHFVTFIVCASELKIPGKHWCNTVIGSLLYIVHIMYVI